MTIGKQNAINEQAPYYAVTTKSPAGSTLYLSIATGSTINPSITVTSHEWTPNSKASLTRSRSEASEWSKRYGGKVEEVPPL